MIIYKIGVANYGFTTKTEELLRNVYFCVEKAFDGQYL